jgi:hypothetical protein
MVITECHRHHLTESIEPIWRHERGCAPCIERRQKNCYRAMTSGVAVGPEFFVLERTPNLPIFGRDLEEICEAAPSCWDGEDVKRQYGGVGHARTNARACQNDSRTSGAVRDFVRDFSPSIPGKGRILFGFRAPELEALNCESPLFAGVLWFEARTELVASLSSESSDAPALPAPSPARSSPRPRACGR